MKKTYGKISTALIVLLLLVGMLSATALAAPLSLPDSTERKLHIYKYEPVDTSAEHGDGTQETITGKNPLANVEFEIYKVPDDATTSKVPTPGEIAAIAVADNLIDTVTTNSAGLATKSFGTGSLDGKYLIVEKDNLAVSAKADPFYVHIPYTNPEGTGWLYDVYVYPKNNVKPAPEVDKDVVEVGNDETNADVGDKFTYIIRGEVPDDLWWEDTKGIGVPAEKYEFYDKLAPELDYEGNVQVKYLKKDNTEVTLTTTTHYTVTTTPENAAAGTPGVALTVTLTNAGKEAVMKGLDTGDTEPEIRVYFDASINETAVLGEKIENNVSLTYTNSNGKEFDPKDVPEGERPKVKTGGLVIEKIDAASRANLAGAKFKIARKVKEGETPTDTITLVGGDVINVVFVDFYPANPMGTTTAVTEITTGNDGKAVISGLAYGEYYLVETAAPAGYNLLSWPKEVTIGATTHNTVVTVNNSEKFTLPRTGGTGTVLFTISGVTLVGLAVILLVINKRKQTAK